MFKSKDTNRFKLPRKHQSGCNKLYVNEVVPTQIIPAYCSAGLIILVPLGQSTNTNNATGTLSAVVFCMNHPRIVLDNEITDYTRGS